MAFSENDLHDEWTEARRFPNGNNLKLRTVQLAIKNACDEAGIPVAFRDDQLKTGGVFKRETEDILYMYNPEHVSDYLRFAVRLQHTGNFAFMHVYNLGGSKNYRADNLAGSEGTLGAIQRGINLFGGHKGKLEAEEQYYQLLKDCLDSCDVSSVSGRQSAAQPEMPQRSAPVAQPEMPQRSAPDEFSPILLQGGKCCICGKVNAEGKSFCDECGLPLPASVLDPTPEPVTPDDNGNVTASLEESVNKKPWKYSYAKQANLYDVDVCILIDKTGSMRPIIKTVKENALRLYSDITKAMAEKNKKISNFRVRVMAYGDYMADGAGAFYGCDFLHMPEQGELLEQCVNSIRAEGGGDEPEDGLEALAFGIRSKWCTGNNKKRHIICLFTDASAHDLGFGRSVPGYPADAPKSFEELTCMWGTPQFPGEMDPYAKRLILYAPDCSYWSRIGRSWDNTIQSPVESGKGLVDVSYDELVNTIGNSI